MQSGPLKEQHIGIIGGSIAGLAVGASLLQLGAKVTILERSEHPLEGRGAGIVLPEPLIQQCIAANLFDKDISRLSVSHRSFITQSHQSIWDQPIAVMCLNWSDIYSQLRKRIPDSHYHQGKMVETLSQTEKVYHLQTQDGSSYSFDFLIGADGIHSGVRNAFFSETTYHYAGYIAWRGVIPLNEVKSNELFSEHIPYFVYPNGHLLLYIIPGQQTDAPLLNWVMYEICSQADLENKLIDTDGNKHEVSIPPGGLNKETQKHLHLFATTHLPSDIAQIICHTEKPFLQAVYDLKAPKVLQDQTCLIGDAALILRPHSASGVVKALMDSLSLVKAFETNDFEAWQQQQQLKAEQLFFISQNMGQGLVAQTPPWSEMTPTLMEEWWNNIMAGKTWHYTPSTLNQKLTVQYDQTIEEQKKVSPTNETKNETKKIAKTTLS
ncbi:FAD binding domain-containing protein [Candidatus Berkiella aquae]|uniref:6-hydroxynicotinate 3-monooxygenase n=1 Tax=Candidatus Berkiella aquae TaxID=295108 RepID=A0A0Q9YPW1_9GAMM|nr:NAD-binding protein [Candidatus Berkiella aquae]MCS5710775.1 hypothetical protein [Candidatus Berkiella aquae]